MRGDGREQPLLLMRSPEAISVSEVRDAIFKKREAMFLGREVTAMYECFSDKKDPRSVSLMDLVSER